VNAPFLLPILGLLYIIVMGGLSLLRREGLSIRFAVESLLVTGIAAGLAWFAGLALHPVVFLILLYLVTMRVRLLVDVGNWLAGSGRFAAAGRVYRLAEQLGPDAASLTAIRLNQGVARLQSGAPQEAAALFEEILRRHEAGGREAHLGIKHEAACWYNLGVAYQRQGQMAKAMEAFRRVLEVWPVSEYARRAAQILKANQGD
jgi:tetratricopeptide (TPR) repeat protein